VKTDICLTGNGQHSCEKMNSPDPNLIAKEREKEINIYCTVGILFDFYNPDDFV